MTSAGSESRRSRRRALAASTAAVVWAGGLAGAGPAPAPGESVAVAPSVLDVRVAETRGFTRIEFRGAQGRRADVRRDGRRVIVRLPVGARPDVARLKVDPPRWLESAEVRRGARGTEVVLTLAEGADVSSGRADDAVFLNLRQAATPEAKAAVERKDPVPPGGVVRVAAEAKDGALALTFPWAAPVGSAVFRRGDSIWIVFDAKATLDLTGAPEALGPVQRVRWAAGPDFTLVRAMAPAGVDASVEAVKDSWTVRFKPGPSAPVRAVAIGRDDQSGPPALTAAMAGANRVIRMTDPAIGDPLTVVTALGPDKAMAREQVFVDARFAPTAHGLLIEEVGPDVSVAVDGDLVRLSRPSGLRLSAATAALKRAPAPLETPQPASAPGVIDYAAWSETGKGGFRARYDQLNDLAAEETAAGEGAPVTARMALVRFLMGSELSHEAIGVMNALAQAEPSMLADAEFRSLRGAARALIGRFAEAQADFATPVLNDEPSAALWRGYVAARQGEWAEARKQFQAGARAVDDYDAERRVRFSRLHADAALQVGDLAAAEALLQYAFDQKAAPPLEQLAARLVQARLFEAQGQVGRAVKVYDAIGRASLGSISTPARLRAIKLRLDRGELSQADAIGRLNTLRWAWRGDAAEMEAARTLGAVHLQAGRYREALDALRSAGKLMTSLPAAVQLNQDLAAAFRYLFLEGGADGLQPVQALALFYDFRDLTPIGADGDEMVRRLARRLIDVDLLDQAAELLRYQVDNRLDGVARASVATDLAIVHLMDRDPQKALEAIWSTRTTVLPTALNGERRIVEARALSDLGRFDHALEVLERDRGPEADDVRAEVFWKQKAWAQAGALLEKRLGDRWRSPAPLTGEEETRLIRSGIAYSLAGDAAALARLNTRWSGFVEGARAPDAIRVALTSADVSLSPAEYARAAAQADSFAGWVAAMKAKFRERPEVGPRRPASSVLDRPTQTAALGSPAPIAARPASVKPAGPPKPASGAEKESNTFF
jgi:tetratricopeptide (TPR) repeat protein